MSSISTYSIDDEHIKHDTAEHVKTRSFADLGGKMTFVQANVDPFNNAVDFTSTAHLYFDDACEMPEGYRDTDIERNKREEEDPFDDSAMLGPRENFDEFVDSRVFPISVSQTNCRLGARSHLWPAIDYEDEGDARTANKNSYSDYNSSDIFDKRAELAMRTGASGPW
jgi:hypothetical protein